MNNKISDDVIKNANILKKCLKELFPSAIEACSGNQIRINCPLCEKEGNPDNHQHMYISLGLNGKPPMFNCFKKPNHKGLLSKSVIEQFINGKQYKCTELDDVFKFSKNNNNKYGLHAVNRKSYYKLFNPSPKVTTFSSEKLKYLNNRLGLYLNYSDLPRYNILLSLYEYLNYNKIDYLTRDKKSTDLLDKYFIGFITNTNFVRMRNIREDINFYNVVGNRYENYKLYRTNFDSPKGYYFIPTIIDTNKKIYARIAEGPFDIMGVYFNIMNGNVNNQIYLEIGGNTYINILKYFTTELGLINIEYHYYIDNDIPKYIIDELKFFTNLLKLDIYIHINTKIGKKDFGFKREDIKEYSYKL